MARERGTFNFSASLEVKKQGALDSRLVIQTYAELVLAATWADSDNKIWLYDGMIVSVVADTTGKNGVYMLTNKDNYSNTSAWTRIDAAAAVQTTVEDVLTSTSATAALSANQGRVLNEAINAHVEDGDVHITADEREKLGNIDSSLVGVAASKLPVSEAVQAELDKKVDAEEGKSLVSNDLITKLDGLKDSTAAAEEIKGITDNIDTIEGNIDTIEGNIEDINDAIDAINNAKGVANGFASLDENGFVPASQLPSFVDDVVEAANFAALPEAGEASKIYVTLDDNKTYRWSGSAYVEISASLALGETTGTAYEGSKGKANAEAIATHVADKENPHSVTAAQLNIDASLVGVAASALPVSTATQAELDKKVAIETGKSLVADTEIAKLAALKDQTSIAGDIESAASAAQSAAIAAAKTETEGQVSAAKGELNQAIADAKAEVQGNLDDEVAARKAADKAITGFEEAYAPNSTTNYIANAANLNDADVKLDAQIKVLANDIAALTGGEEGAGAISEQISTAVNAAKQELNQAIADEAGAREEADKAHDEAIEALQGAVAKEAEDRGKAISDLNTAIQGQIDGINGAASTLSGRVDTAEGEIDALQELTAGHTTAIAENKAAHEANAKSISDLDTAVADFKNKSVGAISAPGSEEVLPTTKAVVDYVTAATNGVAKSMTYTAKEGDASKMELKLIAVDNTVLSTIEMDKENFLSGFVKRAATAEDVAADSTIAVGDPILVVTLVNGDVFRVNLKSLVDIYTGVANKAITTSVDGYVVKAQLNIDSAANTASAVKLTEGDNGLSAALSIDSTKNGANGITLAQDGNGISAALKLDADAIAANGMSASVGANGLSMGIVWTEL